MFSLNSIFFKFLLVSIIFALSTSWMLYLSYEATKLLQSEAILSKNEKLSFPKNIDELKSLSSFLKASYSKNSRFILILYSSAYLYKQTFAIPGSVFLNVLGGSLFGLFDGLIICCSLTTLGALSCFFLAKLVGEPVIKRFFGQKLIEVRKLTSQLNTFSLFCYLLSARLFPASPNWLLNISCPVVGVPWHLFALSVFLGLIPCIYLCVTTGQILSEITSIEHIFTPSILIKFSIGALVTMMPGILKIFFLDKNQPKESDHSTERNKFRK